MGNNKDCHSFRSRRQTDLNIGASRNRLHPHYGDRFRNTGHCGVVHKAPGVVARTNARVSGPDKTNIGHATPASAGSPWYDLGVPPGSHDGMAVGPRCGHNRLRTGPKNESSGFKVELGPNRPGWSVRRGYGGRHGTAYEIRTALGRPCGGRHFLFPVVCGRGWPDGALARVADLVRDLASDADDRGRRRGGLEALRIARADRGTASGATSTAYSGHGV